MASENDAIKLRTNHRKHDVYLYPVQCPRPLIKDLFLDIMIRAQNLSKKPEFYHTLFNNCTSNIATHIRKIAPKSLPRSYKILFSGFSDKLAYELGLIHNTMPYKTVRQNHLITSKALKFVEGNNFSHVIRK